MVFVDAVIFLFVSYNLCVVSAWSNTGPLISSLPFRTQHVRHPWITRFAQEKQDETSTENDQSPPKKKKRISTYSLGLGKNLPVTSLRQKQEKDPSLQLQQDENNATLNWIAPEPVEKPQVGAAKPPYEVGESSSQIKGKPIRTKRVITKNDEESSTLKRALWHEDHYYVSSASDDSATTTANGSSQSINTDGSSASIPEPAVMYPDIDLSIPESVYSQDGNVDLVWDILRYEALYEAQREPLLVSFLHSTILNHKTLESALAFHLANKLASPAMISTQIQSLVLEALQEFDFRRCLRADIMAVRDRDPACTCLPDVFLYFKGFHALQTHRVGHYMYSSGRKVLAFFLQSQMSQNFQIDIHPNATMGRGIMLDHGTGIVVGETARVGHNCSILHHVTLGGSGKQGVDRHPKVGDGVLLGAGVSVLGNVKIGDGCQVGAGTLVITDLPPHSVAVGVPARIIGSFVDVTVQPSLDMNQMMGSQDFDQNILFESEGI